MTVNYVYLGYGTTDENGLAKLDHDANGDAISHSYTGTGAGEVDVVASLDSTISSGSIVSNTYEVDDTAFYDFAVTGNKNDNWLNYGNRATITTDENGTTITGTTSSNCYYLFNNGSYMYTTWVLDVDIVSYNSNVNCGVYLQTDGASTTKDLYFQDIGVPTTGGHLKITFDGSQFTIKVDNTDKNPISFSIGTHEIGFRLNSYSQVQQLKYKNLKVYKL